jgi:16S rRNA (guanine527-N7)-methyltransferase
MDREGILEEGLRYYRISYEKKDLQDLGLYLEILEKWNLRMNLVGLKETALIVKELLYDALFLYRYTEGAGRLMDLGSGSGIVAVPLAILRQDATVFSVDSSLKKIDFQRHVKRTLALANLVPLHGRAEALEPVGADCVVVKAFSGIEKILKLSGGHLAPGGRVLMLKGAGVQPLACPGYSLVSDIPYALPGSPKRYRLLIYRDQGTGEDVRRCS